MRALLFLLMLACTGRAFQTTFVPGETAIAIAWQCDDRVDSQLVNIATQWQVPFNFAPYRIGANTIIDKDSTDFDGNGSITGGEYGKWLIQRYADPNLIEYSTHSTENVVSDDLTREEMLANWTSERNWLRSVVPVPDDVIGHVWTGHRNSAEARALAKDFGYTFTRGAWPDSKDLYLPAFGWELQDSVKYGLSAVPACMVHRALIPHFGMSSFFANGTIPQNQNVADSTGIWNGTKRTLTNAAKAGGALYVANIHPGWGEGWSETQADTIAAVYARIPNTFAGTADSVMFSKRRGAAGSVDASPYQASIMFKAMKYWDDSCFAADGVHRLAIVSLNDAIRSAGPNWRNDNSGDPDSVTDWRSGAVAGDITDDYWTSNTGLYARDPALDLTRTIYVDGTGTVKAGNGTLQYPLPKTALDRLFNCRVKFVGHDVGDTLIFTGEDWTCANVDVDFAGLTLLPKTAGTSAIRFVTTAPDFYINNITLRNFKLDLRATTATTAGLFIGSVGTTPADSLRATAITLKGATFINGENHVYANTCKDVVVDSCFFYPSWGSINDNADNYCIQASAYTKNLLVRNSYFDFDSCGTRTNVLYLQGALPDSARILNNAMQFGNTLDTDDIHVVVSSQSVRSGAKVRLAGNYIANSITGADAAKLWRDSGTLRTLTAFKDTVEVYNPSLDHLKNYQATGYAIGTYNYITNASDSTRFGGFNGTGSLSDNGNTWIGPAQYGYLPLMWTSGAVQGRPATATLAGPWEVLSLVNAGVLTASSATDTDTWFEIPRIYNESDMAVARSFLDAWEAWPAANQAKVRFKVSGEPIAVIRSADSTYQTLGQLDAAITAVAETAADSLDASTWFSLDRPYNLNAAFQIEILRAWHRTLAEANRKLIRFRVAGTDYSMADTDSIYSQGLWGMLADIGTGATAADSLNASTWFMAPRVYDMAQAQQFGIYRDAWSGWPLATQKKVRMRTK